MKIFAQVLSGIYIPFRLLLLNLQYEFLFAFYSWILEMVFCTPPICKHP